MLKMINLSINIFFWIFLFLAIFFLVIGLYARNYGRREEPSETLETSKKESFYEKIKGKLGGKIKRPKISLGWIIVTIILMVLGINYIYSNYIATTVYTFNSTNSLSSNWQINSGSNNLKVENGCLIIEGQTSMTLKGSENMHWSEIKVTPCDDRELNNVFVRAGNLVFQYYFGPPPDTNYAWDKGSTYHVGAISTSAGTKVSVFFPSTGNVKRNNKPRFLLIERGAVIMPNYKMSAVGSGTFDSVTLADAYYSETAGKGRINIETINSQRIKKIEVTEGLLIRIKETIGWV